MHLSTILLAPGIFAILAAAKSVSVKANTKLVPGRAACYLKIDYKGCSGQSGMLGMPSDVKGGADCSSWANAPNVFDVRLDGKGCDGYSLRLENKNDVYFIKDGKSLASCHMDNMVADKDGCDLKKK